ncbi:DUF721 domain-containing protein [Streptomyces cyaneofuscatus]|uniref:hypothetical protein n=1 Tax=Streptomyces cyaneofuscatus TaxID=66883 RepID=UPI003830245C
MSGNEMSGVDLVRQALLTAREATKKNGAIRQKPKRRTATAVRREDREPLGLVAAIGVMMTERGMVAPAVGGSVLADYRASWITRQHTSLDVRRPPSWDVAGTWIREPFTLAVHGSTCAIAW